MHCHRCQQPGHIVRHCRAPAPVRTGRHKPSVTASAAPDGDARASAVPTVAVEREKRSYGVDRKGVLSLTDTSSEALAVSQASSNKPRGQHRRARRKATSPRSHDEMPDLENPETGCTGVLCRRPTNTVTGVEPVESRPGQLIAGGIQKACAIRDAP